MFTMPTIVTSNDLERRAYITFYFENKRIREYKGNNLDLRIYPNYAKTLEDRFRLLEKLRFELHKALDSGDYPIKKSPGFKTSGTKSQKTKEREAPSVILTLFNAVRTKLCSRS